MDNEKRKLIDGIAHWFCEQFPSRLDTRRIGFEKEMPVVDVATLEMADFRGPVFSALQNDGWHSQSDDVYGEETVSVEKSGYLLLPDSDYGTVEVNFPPTSTLTELRENIAYIENLLANIGIENGIRFLGYGIQPKTAPNKNLWIKRGRYETLTGALPDEVHNVTVAASDQAHIDIASHEIVDVVNVLNALTPAFIYLFANSPIWKGKRDADGRVAPREEFWDVLTKEPRVGVPPRPFESLADFVEFSIDLQFILSKVDNQYFQPGSSFAEWIVHQNVSDWKQEWLYHEGCLWWDARPRVEYGTVEFRPVCSQRQGESVHTAALTLGIVNNLPQAKELVESRPWQDWVDLRMDAIYNRNDQLLNEIAKDVVNVALGGLDSEDKPLLSAICKRCLSADTPAMSAIRAFRSGGLAELVEETHLKCVQ